MDSLEKNPKTQRNIRDTFFHSLFQDKEKASDLYNQIASTPLSPDSKVQIITLDETLFVERINDLGMLVDDRLIVLVEQQSTSNENMALRMLLYLSREYERVLQKRDTIYSSKRIYIPSPEFYVIYNGEKPLPETESIQKLSDSFIENNGNLELLVKIIDLNRLELQQGSWLQQYVTATNELYRCRRNKGNMRKCVEQLIGRNILKDFLSASGSEVINMLTFEFDMNEYGKVKHREGVEEGIKEGIAEGIKEGIAEGIKATAVRCIKQGRLNDDEISDVTGLSLEQISELRKSLE